VFGADPADVVAIEGKVKARCGTVRYVGDWQGATTFVLAGQMAWVHQAARGAASATGESGAASAMGESAVAVVTGLNGCVLGGPFSVLALAWWNHETSRQEMRCAEIGVGDGADRKLKRDVWYQLDARGVFVEVS